jgi:hypothetical protein
MLKMTMKRIIPRGDLARLRPFLRRGDLLENTAVSGYRSEGVSIYDGRRVTALSYEQDDYGCLGHEYVIYRDFNPLTIGIMRP